MDFQDQFENDEIYQQTQNEFLEHMFLMEEASPHFNRGRGPANPNSRCEYFKNESSSNESRTN